jgi:benzoyl-CoA reductase/2-hydroxyglutaryl-CoA dehydratase subunit BcrC/BadD/HgdB
LAAARAAGRKVIGWIGYNVPEELIHACGLIPIRICQGGDSRLAEIGANYISTQNCYFLRQCVGMFAENTDPYVKQLDVVVTDTTCLQLHRMAALLQHYFHVNVIQLGVPKHPQLPEGRRYFASEVRHLIERLEAVAGTSLDTERLLVTLELYQRIREVIRELYRRVAEPNCAMQWRDAFEVVHAGFCLDRAEYLALLQDLLREVQALSDSAAENCFPHPHPVRILLAGSPIAPHDTKLIDIAEKSGAQIAGDFLWTGFASLADMELKEHSLQGLINCYLNRLPHAALPFMEVDTDRKLSALLEQIKQSRAQGVIYYSLRFCDPFSFKMLATKEYLKCEGVPLMEAQTDYGAMDTETLHTRVEAFIEMLAIRA